MSGLVPAALALVLIASAAGAEPRFQDDAIRLVGPDQNVYAVAEDGTVLASLNATRPVHPASVTKVATTLALLERLGPAHRFETRLVAGGPLRDGTVAGDLIVEAGGDPAIVSEDAFRMLEELRGAGVRRVRGGMRVRGPLIFNWQPDPAGNALRRTFEGRGERAAWDRAAATWPALMDRSPRALALAFDGGRAVDGQARPLLVHRSATLVPLVKALNGYSNNVFHLVSDRIGGPSTVELIAREHVAAELRDEIVITNAAGAGKTNRMSPRAAVAIVDALRATLAKHGRGLVDVLPVAGIDPGTLRNRLHGGMLVGKTGTIGSLGISALTGVLRTRRHGRITFAVLNRGLPVPDAHRRQDAFVRALADAAEAQPWEHPGVAPPVYVTAEVQAIGAEVVP